ncbi:FprA family A-type flavoprotein [Candidatus Bathyarchaeota archaeon]|nr:FprA family A-type flavoprotein [Candidatus Bathyarchaeota archaeon]
MVIHFIPEIADRVHYVGVRDPDRRMFDALVPLPQGTTYNSYLVKGEAKTALIDTVNPGFEDEFVERISMVSSVEEIDYVIMNHAEPDHASAISYVLSKNSKANLLVTKRGADAAKLYFNIPEDRIRVITDGETIDLGGKTLRFIVAPMLHWPETMFSYLEEDGVLFSCDFYGLHTAYGLYDDQVPNMIQYAQRYFGEIMMPYKSMGKRAIDKIRDLDIKVIAPSHGPIHRNPESIMGVYEKWTVGETNDKVIVVYATMWKNTEKMVKQLVAVLEERGIEVPVYNLEHADIGEIAKDLVDARGIVLGTPTVVGRMHPLAVYATHLVTILRPPVKYGVVLTSYGWGKGALSHASEILGPTGLEVVGVMEVNGPPSQENYSEIRAIAGSLADKVLLEK